MLGLWKRLNSSSWTVVSVNQLLKPIFSSNKYTFLEVVRWFLIKKMAIESPTLRNSQSTYFTAFVFVYLMVTRSQLLFLDQLKNNSFSVHSVAKCQHVNCGQGRKGKIPHYVSPVKATSSVQTQTQKARSSKQIKDTLWCVSSKKHFIISCSCRVKRCTHEQKQRV